MKHLKKPILLAAALLALASCEGVKAPGGNQMVAGSRAYYYALVFSQITETRYYHIQGWAEYGPEGGAKSYDAYAPYVGLELQLANFDVVYRYEPGLAYELSKSLNAKYAQTYGVIGD